MDAKARRWGRSAQLLIAVAATVLGCAMIAVLPRLVGVSWTSIGANLATVSPFALLGLLVLWFAGLLVHAPVLMAAMPGLTARQALTLNMSGSAVSNLLPLGGPAGMGLGYAMARSWGFTAESYAAYTVSTNLWNMVGRFAVGISVLAAAATFGVALPSGLGPVVIGAVGFLTLGVGSAAAALRSPASTIVFGRRVDRLARRLRPGHTDLFCTAWLLSCRDELMAAVRTSWRRMTAGVVAYLFLQGALLFACLATTGAGAPITAVAIAFAIERLISLAPITPGAAGVAELGTVAALQSLGVDPVGAAAGVLLYRLLMFAVDIPIGGALALGWLHQSRRTAVPGVRVQEPVVVGATS